VYILIVRKKNLHVFKFKKIEILFFDYFLLKVQTM